MVAQPHVMAVLAAQGSPRFLDAGDAAFTVEFGSIISPALLAAVNALDIAIAQAAAAGQLLGLVETMPTFRSLTVFFDPLLAERSALQAAVAALLQDGGSGKPAASRRWRLPVCYDTECGPDLADTAQAIGSTVQEVVRLHSSTEVQVYMLGFLPGFPFMGDMPKPLCLPRRTQPRVRVPAGSVSIAGGLTAIYPWESPGGWHLLGRCPVPLFDAQREFPSLLQAGDRVSFEPVSRAEHDRLWAALREAEIDPGRYQLEAAPKGQGGEPPAAST